MIYLLTIEISFRSLLIYNLHSGSFLVFLSKITQILPMLFLPLFFLAFFTVSSIQFFSMLDFRWQSIFPNLPRRYNLSLLTPKGCPYFRDKGQPGNLQKNTFHLPRSLIFHVWKRVLRLCLISSEWTLIYRQAHHLLKSQDYVYYIRYFCWSLYFNVSATQTTFFYHCFGPLPNSIVLTTLIIFCNMPP